MKLRQLPEDFRVTEINNIAVSKEKSDYKVYLLEKKGIETFALLDHLSRKFHIQKSDIGIAGLKDKHALTEQKISIPTKCDMPEFEEKNLKIKFLGHSKNPIKPGNLIGNSFEITLRDIKSSEIKKMAENSKHLDSVPNYFDSQRFGSVIHGNFIAKSVMQNDYDSAVKSYLTQYTRHEKSSAKQQKRLILENWNALDNLGIKGLPGAIIDEYLKTKSWLAAYKRIPLNIREMFVSAYQSYLWNECIKELLKTKVKRLYSVDYNAGTLIFYDKLDSELPQTFTTIGPEMKPRDYEEIIIKKVMQKQGISAEQLNIKESGAYFRIYDRNVLLRPEKFTLSEALDDELNNGRLKIIVKFDLPKGSYATVVIKRLFL